MQANSLTTEQIRALIAKGKLKDAIFKVLGIFCLAVALLVIVLLVSDMVAKGSERLTLDFFLNFASRRATQAGILSAWVGSLLVMTVTALAAVPLGVAAGLYLEEYAKRNWITEIIEINITNLAAVPSIVYGFLGVIILVSYLQDSFDMLTGRSILAGAILLGIMFIPYLTTICEDSLRAVPSEFKEGSLALGANRWQTLRNVTIPAASSGITAAVLLNIGSIIGETMAVLLVVGNVARLPSPIYNIFGQGATFTSVIAGEMG